MRQHLNPAVPAAVGGLVSALLLTLPGGADRPAAAVVQAAHPAANAATAPALAVLAAPTATATTAASRPATTAGPPDAGQLRPLPSITTDQLDRNSCDSTAVAHPSGFASMGGTGTDTVRGPGSQNDTGAMAQDHIPVEFHCLNPTTSGDLVIEMVVLPLGSDSTAWQLQVGPDGLTALSVTPGHDFATVPVNQRLGAWPGGCHHLTLSHAGPDTASVDDTLCFAPSGALTTLTLHESAHRADGTTRALDASLTVFPNG